MIRSLQYFLILLFACLIGCADSAPAGSQATENDTTEGTAADNDNEAGSVEIQVLDFDGIGQLVKSHQGKVVVMDAWSTSCQPCVKEFPNLVKLHHDYGPKNIACISLSFDYEGIDEIEVDKQRALGFLKQQKATFDNVISSEESDVLYQKFDLAAVPAIFVYDRQGKLVKRFEGEPEEGELYDGVRTLVSELMQNSPEEGK